MSFDSDYLGFVNAVVTGGEKRQTRAGPTRSTFGSFIHINCLLRGQFPILTTRKMFPKPILGELAAFLRGASLLSEFQMLGCNYWNANAAAWPANAKYHPAAWHVGKVYGAQWRYWTGLHGTQVDQLENLITSLREDSNSRRHILTTWNPAELSLGCLPPCHILAQFNVCNSKHLDCVVYMRSVDLCLGLPSDIILYAALLILIADEVSLKPGRLTFMLADTHIYENHVERFKKQLSAPDYGLPTYTLSPEASLDNFKPEHLEINNYQHGEKIDYPFAV